METRHSVGRAFFVLRPQGNQAKYDIVAMANELAHVQRGGAALRLLFDWTQVHTWPFATPTDVAVQTWKQTAPLIARAAIVHHPKWNRHAAFLAALMRVGNAQVRCLLSPNYEKAAEWLERILPTVKDGFGDFEI
jgi:hypothetical protein